MTKLLVETEDFAAASSSMRHEVAENLHLCLDGLTGRLESELVGVDPAGVAWAADYDTSARAVLAATAQVANAAYRTSRVFAASGRNYDTAEVASTTGGAPFTDTWIALLADPPIARVGTVPTAGGAGADTPANWWLVSHTIGYVWPGGHQDRLRHTADHWRSAARSLDAAVGVPLGIGATFARDHLPEADSIITVCSRYYDRLTTLVNGYRALADACDAYAAHLDDCHRAVEDELAELALESAALQTGGALLSLVSFGAAEIPTQAAQAGRIALAVTRIGHLIDKLIAAAGTIATAVRAIGHVARETKIAMTDLTITRLAYAGVTQAPRLERAAMAAKDGEKAVGAANGGLGPGKVAKLPGKLVNRKPGDPGHWKNQSSLADHVDKHGLEFGTSDPDEYARMASDFLQRSFRERLPMKVDEHGTIRTWDPETNCFGSYRSDGATYTYFKPKDPAKYWANQKGVSQW